MVPGDDRSERVPRRVHAHDGAGEHGDRHPHPRAGADLAPAVMKITQHRARLRRGVVAGHPGHRPGMHAHRQQRADDKRRGVERERLAGPDAEHEQRGQSGSDEERQVRHRLGDRFRVLKQLRRHGLRDQPGVRRLEEGLREPEQNLDHDELPDRERPREDQRREQRVQHRAGHVGGDDDSLPGQSVGPDAAEQQQRHKRERLRSENKSQVRRRAGALRDVQRERDEHDAVADRAGGLTEEQISKVGEAQDAQIRTHGTHSTERDQTARRRKDGRPGASARGGGTALSHGRALSIAPHRVPTEASRPA